MMHTFSAAKAHTSTARYQWRRPFGMHTRAVIQSHDPKMNNQDQ